MARLMQPSPPKIMHRNDPRHGSLGCDHWSTSAWSSTAAQPLQVKELEMQGGLDFTPPLCVIVQSSCLPSCQCGVAGQSAVLGITQKCRADLHTFPNTCLSYSVKSFCLCP